MDVTELRQDFPALDRAVNGQPLAYLDNAATAHKPQEVIDTVTEFYEEHNANVHRCVHQLGTEATALYDDAHAAVAQFIGADWDEIVFVRNTTEALNLAAYSHAMQTLSGDDEILLTGMEHHSMIVPMQHAAEQTGATLRYADITGEGTLDMDDVHSKLSDDTGIVAATHLSNVLGTVNPVQELADAAHSHGADIIVDAAQSVPHIPVDVNDLEADLLAFSGHKMCGPTGIGALYGRKELLAGMEPFLRGGDMISRVSDHDAEWNDLPWKFEAGTPNIAGAAGFAAAVDYLDEVGMQNIQDHSKRLAEDAYQRLSRIDGVTVYGPADRCSLVSFTVDGAHPHDLSSLLNEQGIAIRGGHHCAQPLADRLGVTATARASFYLYNTGDELDRLEDAVRDAVEVFGG
ncbi:MAG: SufS family cysteine desulfurase [Candidatus Nanohaloarchaea archaeon]|nr:SufS family cysteine desulfurase [Candidatus Nanohaloarchaea archaeon]